MKRRTLVGAMAALGAGRLAAASGALASLGTLGACAERRPLQPGLEPELNIYNWSDYIGRETIAGFEYETGVRVTYDTYESNEEMAARLVAGATGYDLCVPSSYLLPPLVAGGLLQPLDPARLPGWEHLEPLFTTRGVAGGATYGVPWQWGMTGIAYRADLLPVAPSSWRAFLEPGPAAARMTMLDDGREVLGAMLKMRGRSLNSTDPAELRTAGDDALAAKANLAAYVSAPVKGQLVAGDIWMAQLWNGDTRQAQLEQPQLAFALPEEGSLLWTDYLAIPHGAPHPRSARAFVEYVLRPEVAAGISEATGYGSPNRGAIERMRDPIRYPTVEQLARLEYQRDLGSATELWDRTWTEVKAG